MKLPIEEVLPEIEHALREHGAVVLRAPTGAGKTTRVPPYLFDAGLADGRRVVVLEPRRVAARSAARRVAAERGVELGGEVGYQVRFDRKTSARTRIAYVTEGLFLRQLQEDPFLEDVGCVVLDEFHERSLDVDLALALLARVREARPDLRLVVTSATLDPAPLQRYLKDCPFVESEGRLYPVDVTYLDPRAAAAQRTDRLEDRVATAVHEALEACRGDVLVFLPGLGEIRRVGEALADTATRRGLEVLELYGDLPLDRQDAALRPLPRRKVVLATNVAETSVTVEGVECVVDSGVARVLQQEPGTGLERLVLGPISQASADQRSGRAGRTQSGRAFRLWTELEHRALPAADTPEIARADLAGPALELLCFGEDPRAFPWFEAPPDAHLEPALELLARLGAAGPNGPTALGRRMSALPVHPRIARMLLAGRDLGHADTVALAAALLTERSPYPRERPREARRWTDSDLLERVLDLERFEDGDGGRLLRGPARAVLRARDQLVRELRGRRGRGGSTRDEDGNAEGRGPAPPDRAAALARAVFAAWPDRVARRRENDPMRGVMVGGRGVKLALESGVREAELFACVELDGRGDEALVRAASAVERAWLPDSQVRRSAAARFDPERERVVGVHRTTFLDLVLEEREGAKVSDEDAAAALTEAAERDLERALDLGRAEVRTFVQRVHFLREHRPELALPELDDAFFRELLPYLCAGRRSFAELRKAPLLDFVRGALSPDQLAALEREAPERLRVPSGSRIALQYEPGRPPVLAARIQELFGQKETPAVAGGRVKVLVHLLAPNMRPQQVTDDLESFWSNTYGVVRKELRRRYPRHAWPEDPTQAVPERRPKRRPRPD